MKLLLISNNLTERLGEKLNKRKISKNNYRFMEHELDFMEKEGELSAQQKSSFLSRYEIVNGVSFIRVLLTVGAFLIGIGVLSFVASNWSKIDDLFKFLLILSAIIGVNMLGFRLERTQPKTARTMHYIGVLFFGAGIFLIGQMFNLGGEFQQAFLLWAVGIIPIGYVLRDRVVLGFSGMNLIIYGFGFADSGLLNLPYATLVLFPLLYWMNRKLGYSKGLTFVLNIVGIQFLVLLVMKTMDSMYFESYIYQILVVFLIGIAMLYLPVAEAIRDVFRVQGHFIHGLTGIIMTIPEVWGDFQNIAPVSVIFSIVYFIFILFLINRGSLFSIVLLFVLILRFYIDLSLDFMPKSLVFIIGGVILVSFGYLFERRRRKGGMIGE